VPGVRGRDSGHGIRASRHRMGFCFPPDTRYLTPVIMVCADPLYGSAALPVRQRVLASASSVYQLPNLSTEIFVWRLHSEDADPSSGLYPGGGKMGATSAPPRRSRAAPPHLRRGATSGTPLLIQEGAAGSAGGWLQGRRGGYSGVVVVAVAAGWPGKFGAGLGIFRRGGSRTAPRSPQKRAEDRSPRRNLSRCS